ncbi:MAG: hypothetical protein HQM08_06275 [Candidatus Riflebacteria bacterium]|nr:hypothetical protein [Candidatus Riflebacteria bacterium]
MRKILGEALVAAQNETCYREVDYRRTAANWTNSDSHRTSPTGNILLLWLWCYFHSEAIAVVSRLATHDRVTGAVCSQLYREFDRVCFLVDTKNR